MALDRESIKASLLAAKVDAGPARSELLKTLDRALSTDNLDGGVRLDFYTDREAFAETVEVLGLDKLITDNHPLHIHQATSGTLGSNAFVGSSLEALRNLKLVEALDVLQSYHWSTHAGYHGAPELDAPRYPVNTKLVIVHTKDEDGEIWADPEQRGVILKASYFAGGLVIDEYSSYAEDQPLAEITKENDRHPSKRVTAIAEFLAANEYTLQTPYSTYELLVGELAISGASLLDDIDAVRVDQNFPVGS